MALLIKSIITSNGYVIGLDGRSCKHIVIYQMQYLTWHDPDFCQNNTFSRWWNKFLIFPRELPTELGALWKAVKTYSTTTSSTFQRIFVAFSEYFIYIFNYLNKTKQNKEVCAPDSDKNLRIPWKTLQSWVEIFILSGLYSIHTISFFFLHSCKMVELHFLPSIVAFPSDMEILCQIWARIWELREAPPKTDFMGIFPKGVLQIPYSSFLLYIQIENGIKWQKIWSNKW